jgi:glycosyltransferase involved in cell wall biosynthesis
MKNLRVSVIMPAFNAEEFIAAAIASVLRQTYQHWELVVIDDGSKDGTATILRRFLSADDRIVCITQENRGLAAARNVGIRSATGELIAFLDSDDLWTEEKLETQVKVLMETNSDFVYSDGYLFSENQVFDESQTFSSIPGLMVFGKMAGSVFYNHLYASNRIPILSVLVRKSVLLEVGLFDEDPGIFGAEDYDLWLRLARHGVTFYGIEKPLTRYRCHAKAMSRNQVRMKKSEVAVIERQAGGSDDDRELGRNRRSALYWDLAMALVEKGETREAREWVRKARAVAGGGWKTMSHLVLLWVMPRHYRKVSSFFARLQASLAYRLGKPLQGMTGRFDWIRGMSK